MIGDVSFRNALEQQVISLLQAQVGEGTDPTFCVRTWDTYLHDANIEDYPYAVVICRQVEQFNPGEMGTLMELNDWKVLIYYLDITKDGETFKDGENRRDIIGHKIQYALEQDPRLGNFRVDLQVQNDPYNQADRTEYVYDSNFTTILFDSSGQEDFFYFTIEFDLSVLTSKN